MCVCVCQVRCLEEENESLEAQIIEMEEQLSAKPSPTSSISLDCPSDSSLEAIIERLRREKVFKHTSTRHIIIINDNNNSCHLRRFVLWCMYRAIKKIFLEDVYMVMKLGCVYLPLTNVISALG